jgi:hypothetical protein
MLLKNALERPDWLASSGMLPKPEKRLEASGPEFLASARNDQPTSAGAEKKKGGKITR